MKNLITLFLKSAMASFLLFISSCNSTENFSGMKLSESEKQKIIEHARKFIYTVKLKNISKEDRFFVKNNKPKFNVDYTGVKQGLATVFWKIDDSTALKITCDGNLLDKSVPTRLTIMKCLKQ
jgi:hypothetical protein